MTVGVSLTWRVYSILCNLNLDNSSISSTRGVSLACTEWLWLEIKIREGCWVMIWTTENRRSHDQVCTVGLANRVSLVDDQTHMCTRHRIRPTRSPRPRKL